MRHLLLAVTALFLSLALYAQDVPRYRVDPAWPLDLPEVMILGQVSGIAVGADDHIWLVHRPRSLAESEMGLVLRPALGLCCRPAPAVIEFDAEGNYVQGWGGPHWNEVEQRWDPPAYDWPQSEHGIYLDEEGYVWLGGNGADDHMVLKFTRAGEHLLTIGRVGETGGSNDTERLGRPADIFVDTAAREVYVADGYLNRRIAVFDSQTGAYKRHWGAYGETPSDAALPAYDPNAAPARQFRGPVHSVVLSRDGEVYVADRENDRIQVFDRSGAFLREAFIAPATLGNGSVWDLALSRDPDEQWLFLADGRNMRVWIIERATMEPVASFGQGGRQAGQFDWVHNLAIDSAGNLYTAEVNNGRRVQKFTPTE